MTNFTNIGRIFYGAAIVGIGFPAIYFNASPYILFPPLKLLTPGPAILHYIFGAMFILVGACIVFEKKTRPVSFLFGCVLLLIFCFLFIPYEFMVSPNYSQLAEWENAEKELDLAGGAFIIAACFSEKNENPLKRFWEKLMRFGSILFSIPIISYGILHFQFAKDVSTMVPSWIPYHLFWTYLAGIGLLGSGVAIILKIKTRLIATLLGSIILIWFITIHIPGVITSSFAELGDQITSASLALAYSGIAFVIAGAAKEKVRTVAG
jgi:uncharacterized membrane protein YphA (DoxX/SURF4 family)